MDSPLVRVTPDEFLPLPFLLHLFLVSEVDGAYTRGADWWSTLLACVLDASLPTRNQVVNELFAVRLVWATMQVSDCLKGWWK